MAEDKILLEGMVFYAYHGADPAERRLGQRFVVDLELWVDLRRPGRTDRLEDTVNYSQVFRAVREVVEGPPRDLLEALAQAIADRVLEGFPVEAVRVRVKKPQVAIKGSVLSYAGVEIYRRRDGTAPTDPG